MNDSLSSREVSETSLGKWEALEDIEAKRVERGFGAIAERFLRARFEGGPPSWVLDKKVFRRVLETHLPPGHSIVDVRRELSGAQRAHRASRAHDRLKSALALVPDLPESAPNGSYLVWASPVVRPRGFPIRALVGAKAVARSEVARAVCDLWSSPYLEGTLAEVPSGVRKVEIAVGITLVPSNQIPSRVYGLLPEVYEAREVGYPAPSLSVSKAIAPPLVRGQVETILDATIDALAIITGEKSPRKLALGAELALDPALAQEIISSFDLEVVRGVVDEVIGRPRERVPVGRAGGSSLELLKSGRIALARAASVSELERRVDRVRGAVEERGRSLGELDLAVLPDDGLRTTIEQQSRLFETCCRLAAECFVTSRLLCHTYASLSGVPLGLVDAGLAVPLLGPLERFEAMMEVVRNDASKRPGEGLVVRGTQTARALREFRELHPELFGLSADDEIPRALALAAELALDRPVDIALACRNARVRLDREVIDREAEKPRLLVPLLSPLRKLARDATLAAAAARLAEVRAAHFLLTTFTEADRRLHRLEQGLGERPAFELSVAELIEALDMRGTSLRARAEWRRSEARAPREVENLGLAAMRMLPLAFRLPYAENSEFSGRFGDCLAVLARAIDAPLAVRSGA